MDRRTGSWHSPSLQREMHVATWGSRGKPVLLFPTAGGDFLECERFLMIRVLTELIDAGRIRVYACGSVSGEGWLDKEAPPWHKSWIQARFDDYLVRELFPHIERDSGRRDLVATGASLGAYNAITAATKHPDWFDLAIGMSGTYEFDRWMGNHRDENYYFNQPNYFLPGLSDPRALAQLRGVRFVLASGQGRAEAPYESVRLAKLLESKGVTADLEIWGPDAHHDWPTWRTMLPMFLSKLVP